MLSAELMTLPIELLNNRSSPFLVRLQEYSNRKKISFSVKEREAVTITEQSVTIPIMHWSIFLKKYRKPSLKMQNRIVINTINTFCHVMTIYKNPKKSNLYFS